MKQFTIIFAKNIYKLIVCLKDFTGLSRNFYMIVTFFFSIQSSKTSIIIYSYLIYSSMLYVYVTEVKTSWRASNSDVTIILCLHILAPGRTYMRWLMIRKSFFISCASSALCFMRRMCKCVCVFKFLLWKYICEKNYMNLYRKDNIYSVCYWIAIYIYIYFRVKKLEFLPYDYLV